MPNVMLTPAPPRGSPVMQDDGKFVQAWSGWFRNLSNTFDNNVTYTNGQLTAINGKLAGGITTTATLAKLTTGGTNGSLTIVNGIITAYTAPT